RPNQERSGSGPSRNGRGDLCRCLGLESPRLYQTTHDLCGPLRLGHTADHDRRLGYAPITIERKSIAMEDPASFQPFDLQRMFIGDLPWTYTFEVVVRTIIMYIYTLLLIRLLSRRAIGQLSLIEFFL